MARILIKGARCVLPSGIEPVDVLIESSKIVHVGVPAGARIDETIDATGLHLLPGVIDDQVHFRDPGATHKEDLITGSRAAARGGVTTFFDMPNTNPETITVARLHKKLDDAASKCRVNYAFYMGATSDNVEELAAAERTPGIKIFIGSSTGNLLVDDQEALERIFAGTTLPITAHCEDESTIRAAQEAHRGEYQVADHSQIRSREAAVIATRRAIDLAERHRHRFHVLHVSTADEIPLIRAAQGLVTAEVCIHHLLLNIDDYDRLGTLAQMNPSLKEADDNEALFQALIDGDIQIIATDHAPHTLEEKRVPYPHSPSGVPAIENSLALMLDQVQRGRFTLPDLVRFMCEGPARIWDLVDKGRIEEGFDADLVLVDLDRTETIRNETQWSRSGWSPWDGLAVRGWPVRTIVMGETVYADGRLDETVRGREAQFDHSRGGYWG